LSKVSRKSSITKNR